MSVKSLKQRLDEMENIQLHNGEDLVVIGKSKITKHYIFIFNTKVLFAWKSFSVFSKKLQEKMEKHSLTEILEDESL